MHATVGTLVDGTGTSRRRGRLPVEQLAAVDERGGV